MVSILVHTIAPVHQPTNLDEYTIASISQSTSPGECTFASLHQSICPVESQRFQVKISGQWCDYGPKEDEVLKQQFDKFAKVAKEPTWNKSEHREAFKEIVIKGRRYVVDFQKMVQVRKDNKKDYKVRPPLQCMDIVSDNSEEYQLGQGDLRLTCEGCGQVYTLRRAASKFDDLDWADCHWCQRCWRPFLEKEDKKNEKNQKMRAQVQLQNGKESKPSAKQHVPHASDSGISTTLGAKSTTLHDPFSRPLKEPAKLSTNSVTCMRCDRGFNDRDILYLDNYEQLRPSIVCHEQCFKSCATLSAQS